jgi:UbiD family decarboxylase
MKPANIRSFLEILKREGELCVIDQQIDPHLELEEIQRRMVARRGPALLFTNVKNTRFPVTTNLFGTRRRIDLALAKALSFQKVEAENLLRQRFTSGIPRSCKTL